MKTTIKREIYLDVLRIIACFLVIICHTYSMAFDKSVVNFNWFFSTTIYFLSKTAVPIFFMISGYLMLRQDYNYKQMLKKIVFKILIPLFVFSFIIYFKKNINFSLENIFQFIKNFISGNIFNQYWFLYDLVGLYLTTPFLRKMIKNFENRDYKIFFLLWIIILGVVPIINNYLKIGLLNNIKFPLFFGWTGYYIAGYYIFNVLKFEENSKYINKYIFALFIVIFISVFITYFDCKTSDFQNYKVFLDKLNFISISLPSISICIILKYFFEKKALNSKCCKLLTILASLTFGIYLIHGQFLGKTKTIFLFLEQYFGSIISCFICQIILFSFSGILVFFAKKIPIIKKII